MSHQPPVHGRSPRARQLAVRASLGLHVLALLDLGCTMDNPAFNQGHETAIADASETRDGESGEESSGDGDPGDGDGDGDGEPGDGDPGDGDGDGEPGDGDGDGDGEPGCNPPLSPCNGMCVDLGSDELNCGECNQKCIGTCEGGGCIGEEHRLVFVSSQLTTGALGGLEGADSFCTELAAQAGIDGSYMAWLSTSQVGPASRMTHFMGPYLLPTGQLIANDWTDLTDGVLAHPIDSDEFGELPPASGICLGQEVWSNSNPNGTPQTQLDCQGWTSQVVSSTSNAGQWSETMFPWSASGCVGVTCAASLPLYCVQQ
jgi:hypothetical protein